MKVAFLHVDAENTVHDYAALASLMVQSVRAAMPNVEIVQMTDTKTMDIPGVDTLIRIKPHCELMPYRLYHLAQFPAGDAIFLDTDVIVRRDLSAVFSEPFDVCLTYRKKGIKFNGSDVAQWMPYNTGVIFSRRPGFFRDAYEHCLTLSADHQLWFGDQLAIKAVADSGKYRVSELPCAQWNYTPNKPDEDVSEKFAVHYKGAPRKAWMLSQGSVAHA